MDYIHDKNMYVIGGYLASFSSRPRCFLFDISVSEAEVLALAESIRFLLEDIGTSEENISIKANSKEMIH